MTLHPLCQKNGVRRCLGNEFFLLLDFHGPLLVLLGLFLFDDLGSGPLQQFLGCYRGSGGVAVVSATQRLIFQILLIHLIHFRNLVRLGLDADPLRHVRKIGLLFVLGLFHHECSRDDVLHVDSLVGVVLTSLAFLLELGQVVDLVPVESHTAELNLLPPQLVFGRYVVPPFCKLLFSEDSTLVSGLSFQVFFFLR